MANAVSAKQLEANVRRALHNVAKSARSRLLSPTLTWSSQPDFSIDSIDAGGDIGERVETDDKRYFFLDEGTSVRHALMTKGFEPKTSPRSFQARPGKGELAYVSRATQMPGIQAREWTQMAELEYGAVLQSAIDKEMAGVANNLFVLTKRFSKYVVDE